MTLDVDGTRAGGCGVMGEEGTATADGGARTGAVGVAQVEVMFGNASGGASGSASGGVSADVSGGTKSIGTPASMRHAACA